MDESHFLIEIFKPSHFSAEELKLVLAQFTQIEFKKNESLIASGKIASYYYFME